MVPFSAHDLALHCARLCQDKGGTELRVLAMPPGAAVCDYIVLVSARSDRQTRAIVDEVYHFCKRHKVPHLPVEGDTGWMLIDCYEVVVHALGVEQREHYALDSLWKTARDLDVDAELTGLANPDQGLVRVGKFASGAPAGTAMAHDQDAAEADADEETEGDEEDGDEEVLDDVAAIDEEAVLDDEPGAAAEVLDDEEAISDDAASEDEAAVDEDDDEEAAADEEAEAAPKAKARPKAKPAPATPRRRRATATDAPKKPASKRVVEKAQPAAPRARGRARKTTASGKTSAPGKAKKSAKDR